MEMQKHSKKLRQKIHVWKYNEHVIPRAKIYLSALMP